MTCSKVLSLVLQAALASRAGDIARSKHYKGVEYLQWQHIKMKLVTQPDGSLRWIMLVTLVYQKGYKDDPSMNQKFKFEELTDPDLFVVCPIKWLLIMALRTSAVQQPSIETLTEAVQNTYNKSIIWSTPNRPVLCAFKQQGCMLDFTRPATEVQLLKSLRFGCELIGMTDLPVTHDIRRGAASDIAHLPERVRGASTEDAARMLNHTASARDRGVTTAYIGTVHEDTWKRRLESNHIDEFGPDIAPRPFKRQRQSVQATLASVNRKDWIRMMPDRETRAVSSV